MEFENSIALFRIGTYSRPLFLIVHSFDRSDHRDENCWFYENSYPPNIYTPSHSYQYQIKGELLNNVPIQDKTRLEAKETLFLLKTIDVWPSRFIMDEYVHNIVVSNICLSSDIGTEFADIEFTIEG